MKKNHIVQSLRTGRIYHKYIGLVIAALVIFSATSGILLAFKKQSDWIQPPSKKGVSTDLSTWLPVDSIASAALSAFRQMHPQQPANQIDRIDLRPSKGMAKVLLEDGWWEVQVDGQTGEVLSVARRHSDWIEAIHDGSIVSELFKLFSMNILGFGLLIMTLTGLWLWYGPKYYKKHKNNF
ncbi:MAG: PepSY domain-containing protein [Saprospiraceae bacterium]|nr:PepSY domain-containing protein [Saprospiraceae bacterium]